MDLADAGEVVSDKVFPLYLISEYYALARFASLLAYRIESDTYAASPDVETIFDRIMRLKRDVASQAATYGYVLEAKTGSDIGRAIPSDEDTGAAWDIIAYNTNWRAN